MGQVEDKHQVRLGAVQETLFIPLAARARETQRKHPVLDDPELVRVILPALRADYRAAETYRYAPGPLLECPVFVLTGDADPEVSLEEARAWTSHTTSICEVRVFEGGHFYLTDHLDAIAASIARRLARVPVKGTAG